MCGQEYNETLVSKDGVKEDTMKREMTRIVYFSSQETISGILCGIFIEKPQEYTQQLVKESKINDERADLSGRK